MEIRDIGFDVLYRCVKGGAGSSISTIHRIAFQSSLAGYAIIWPIVDKIRVLLIG